jgi:hypothetical protein
VGVAGIADRAGLDIAKTAVPANGMKNGAIDGRASRPGTSDSGLTVSGMNEPPGRMTSL